MDQFLSQLKLVIYAVLMTMAGWFAPLSPLPEKQISPTVQVEPQQDSTKVPYCLMGLCPTFYSMDITKGETQSYTVVRQPTHITKGAGEIWVIDGHPNVVFQSNSFSQADVVKSPDHDGFYITYVTGPDYDIKGADKVTFQDGKFTVTENVKLP